VGCSALSIVGTWTAVQEPPQHLLGDITAGLESRPGVAAHQSLQEQTRGIFCTRSVRGSLCAQCSPGPLSGPLSAAEPLLCTAFALAVSARPASRSAPIAPAAPMGEWGAKSSGVGQSLERGRSRRLARRYVRRPAETLPNPVPMPGWLRPGEAADVPGSTEGRRSWSKRGRGLWDPGRWANGSWGCRLALHTLAQRVRRA
jgi:hypothetical protein